MREPPTSTSHKVYSTQKYFLVKVNRTILSRKEIVFDDFAIQSHHLCPNMGNLQGL